MSVCGQLIRAQNTHYKELLIIFFETIRWVIRNLVLNIFVKLSCN